MKSGEVYEPRVVGRAKKVLLHGAITEDDPNIETKLIAWYRDLNDLRESVQKPSLGKLGAKEINV